MNDINLVIASLMLFVCLYWALKDHETVHNSLYKDEYKQSENNKEVNDGELN